MDLRSTANVDQRSTANVDHRSTANVDHRPGRFEESRLTDVVARFLPQDGLDNVFAQFLVAGPCAEAAVEVVLHLREQAGANLAVRGEAHPAACAAKGLADRRDDSDFTHAVSKGVATGCLAGLARRKFDERKRAANALHNFAERDDDLAASRGGPLQEA